MNFQTETFYDAEQKIWSGSKRTDKYGPNVTLGEMILQVLGRNPEKIVQVTDPAGEVMTAAQLLRDSKVIAKHLIDLGLQPGDVVGICAGNTPNLTAVLIAALLCGAPWNAVYRDFDKESIKLIYKITTPKIIFCDEENFETVDIAAKELGLNAKIFITNGCKSGVYCVAELLIGDDFIDDKFPCFTLDSDAAAIILCSSGTTGAPKGIFCSHRMLLNRPILLNVTSESVLFSFSNFYWISAVWTFFLTLLNGGKRIITNQPYSPQYFVELIEKYQITHILTSTYHMTLLSQAADSIIHGAGLPSIDTIICGGTKVPEKLSQKIAAILGNTIKRPGFLTAYGLSEFGTLVSQIPAFENKRYDNEGKLMPNIKARIIEKETGMAVGPNTPGLLYIQMPFKWGGYFRNEQETSKVYDGSWLNTGDIGYFDDDGYLNICARDNDVFKSHHFPIFPEQIEALIMQLPGVMEVCVFGVPDYVATNLVACAIVRRSNEAGLELTAEAVKEIVKRNMHEAFHIKGGVFFVEQLPRTSSGKLERRKVYELIQDRKC